MKKLALGLAISGATLLSAGQVAAYETGDMILRVGIASVQPDVSTGVAALKPLDVDNGEALGFSGTFIVAPNIGVEVLAATPFSHDITAGGAKAGETDHLPPTVTVQYYPMAADSMVQPYIGVGVNYTVFMDEKLNGGAKLNLGNSLGPAFQLGLDYRIDDNWAINAALWKIDINTEVKINGAKAGELEIDPLVIMLGAAYKF